jgi:cytochrome P450
MLSDTDLFLRTLGHVDPADILGLPAWVPRPTKLRGGASIRRLRAQVRQRIDDRSSRIAKGEAAPPDFLTLLLQARGEDGMGFSHDEIEDHLLTFIGAGHETVARTLAWTLYLLAGDPAARERVEAEVDALDTENVQPLEWAGQLPFLRACVEESMRLYPPICHVVRIAIADDTHAGVFVPAGSTVVINIWMLHRHRLHWQQPDAFDPDRFLAPRRATIDRFHYLPFGAGPHVCIGASFAMQELSIVLAILLRRFRFDYAGAEPPRALTRITTQPHNDMPMVVSLR